MQADLHVSGTTVVLVFDERRSNKSNRRRSSRKRRRKSGETKNGSVSNVSYCLQLTAHTVTDAQSQTYRTPKKREKETESSAAFFDCRHRRWCERDDADGDFKSSGGGGGGDCTSNSNRQAGREGNDEEDGEEWWSSVCLC